MKLTMTTEEVLKLLNGEIELRGIRLSNMMPAYHEEIGQGYEFTAEPAQWVMTLTDRGSSWGQIPVYPSAQAVPPADHTTAKG